MDQPRQQRYLTKMASQVSQATGLEYDDLHQQARLAYWQAKNDPRYDPRKASLATFCSRCTFTHLCSYAAKQHNYNEQDVDQTARPGNGRGRLTVEARSTFISCCDPCPMTPRPLST